MHPSWLRVQSLFLGLACLLPCAGLGAYTYDINPLPALPAVGAGLSATAGTLAAQLPSTVLFLTPFRDPRGDRSLWKGDTNFERVDVDAVGLDAQPGLWRTGAFGSESFLWHRQLGQALAASGFRLLQASTPFADSGEGIAAAQKAGATAVLGGEILALRLDKRGADGLFGTNFRGTDYTFALKLRLRVTAPASGAKASEREWDYKHLFHDPTPFGRRGRETFPVYFAQGLSLAAAALGDDAGLRQQLGMPLNMPGASAPPKGQASRSYWVNPKTGRRMNPSWNFDPADGTPRKDFVERWEAATQSSPTAQVRP